MKRTAIFYLIFLMFAKTSTSLELKECRHQLGMSNNKIRNEQISASSHFDQQSTGAQHARAHQETGSGAWCPKHQIHAMSNEWLQISFSADTVITGVETQGRYGEGRGMEYATAFKLQYWRPSINAWASYKDDNELETIPANNDTKHAVRRDLDRAIIARRVRIVPVSNSTRTVCMRVELYGCAFEDSLKSYEITDGDQQSAISFHDFAYDGSFEHQPKLVNGTGKLYDLQIGEEHVFINHHKWVGWRRKRNDNVQLTFNFTENRNISAILIHTANEFSKHARMFFDATIFYTTNNLEFSPMSTFFINPPDTENESPRWIRIPVDNRIGKSVRIILNFASGSDWMFISEVSFESNHTNINYVDEEFTIPNTFYSVVEYEDGTSMFAFIIFFFSFLIIAIIVMIIVYRKRDYRIKASSPSPNAKREILLTIDGDTIKHHVSPSTYQMARDNLQNAMIEKMPMGPVIGDYAEPDISVCSDITVNTPLLYGHDGPYDTHKPSNPLSSLVKYSDYGEVYCTTLPEIARDKLIYISKIGQGEFGEVDMCQLENRRVAVKRLHGISQADEMSFHREIRVLGSLKHPNVVEVVGVCTIQKPILCIMEYMENGDLKSFIMKNPAINTSGCISICTQLAAGLAYLESCNFVHRDIAARNCLVDSEGNVKIADFGMARSLYSQEYYKVEGKFVLPIRWMAWEALLLGKFSTASDVWAFGVTMWEIFSLCAEKPFSGLSDDEVVENLQSMNSTGNLKQTLSRPRLCPQKLYAEQMLPCWNYDANRRPTFEHVHLNLQSMIHLSPHITF